MIQTPTTFVGVQPDAFYTTGMINVVASDESTLELQADSGDPETLQTTVNDGAVTTSFMVSRDENVRLRCLDDTSDASASEFQYDCSN